MALHIAPYIKQQLSSSDILTAIAGDNIFPNWTEEPGLPFVAYEVETGEPEYVKEEGTIDHHVVTITCVARDYDTAGRMAEAARKALEMQTCIMPTYEVTECTMIKAGCEYLDDANVHAYTVQMDVTTEDIV